MVIDIDHAQFLWQRSSYPVWKQFRVNSRELWFLRALYFSLRFHGRAAVSRTNFLRELTGNRKRWGYYEGYRRGLVDKKMVAVYEYIRRPGSESLGITDLGLAVIRFHDGAMQDLLKQYPEPPAELSELHDYFRQTA